MRQTNKKQRRLRIVYRRPPPLFACLPAAVADDGGSHLLAGLCSLTHFPSKRKLCLCPSVNRSEKGTQTLNHFWPVPLCVFVEATATDAALQSRAAQSVNGRCRQCRQKELGPPPSPSSVTNQKAHSVCLCCVPACRSGAAVAAVNERIWHQCSLRCCPSFSQSVSQSASNGRFGCRSGMPFRSVPFD